MAKSLRSKIKKRYRNLKRGHLNQIVEKPRTQLLNNRCEKALLGIQYRQKQHKNAFLHPDDPDAQFPQYKPQPIIDLRSASIPGSGLEWSGACRKKEEEPKLTEEMSDDGLGNDLQKMKMGDIEEDPSKENEMQGEKTALISKNKKKRKSKLKKTIVF